MIDFSPDLSRYTPEGFDRGRSRTVEILWRLVSLVVFESGLCPFYAPKRGLLRRFGALVGCGVLIKPRVKITFPWKVSLGDHVWIGEGVWLDSLAPIHLGSHVCISQGVYVCTGNHDYRSETFDLRVEDVEIESGAWLAARSTVGPGVRVGRNAVLSLGSVATKDLEPGGIYRGNPAVKIGNRSANA